MTQAVSCTETNDIGYDETDDDIILKNYKKPAKKVASGIGKKEEARGMQLGVGAPTSAMFFLKPRSDLRGFYNVSKEVLWKINKNTEVAQACLLWKLKNKNIVVDYEKISIRKLIYGICVSGEYSSVDEISFCATCSTDGYCIAPAHIAPVSRGYKRKKIPPTEFFYSFKKKPKI